MHDGVPTESEIRLEINSSKGNEMPLVAGQIIYLDELFVLNQLWFLMRLDDPTKEKISVCGRFTSMKNICYLLAEYLLLERGTLKLSNHRRKLKAQMAIFTSHVLKAFFPCFKYVVYEGIYLDFDAKSRQNVSQNFVFLKKVRWRCKRIF